MSAQRLIEIGHVKFKDAKETVAIKLVIPSATEVIDPTSCAAWLDEGEAQKVFDFFKSLPSVQDSELVFRDGEVLLAEWQEARAS